MLTEQGMVVFAPDFLALLANREPQPFTAQEAFWAGPWKVAEHGEEFIVHRVSDPTPVAFIQYRETALLVAAALPAVARGPLYWLSAEKAKHGMFDLLTILGEKGPTSVGRLERRHEEVLAPLSALESLLRCPTSMAHLIEAAPREALEQADHLIAERLKRITQDS